MKREFKILIFISIVVIISMSVLVTISKINFHKNIRNANYLIHQIIPIADEVTRNYSDIWRAYRDRHDEFLDYTYYKGNHYNFKDISDAINFKKNIYMTQLRLMEIHLSTLSEDVEKIEKSWFGDSEIKKCCLNLYYDLLQLCRQAISPTGTYESFNSECELLSKSVYRKMAELDLFD